MVHARTIKPGELTSEQIIGAPQQGESAPERIAAAVTREALSQMGRGGPRSLWGAVFVLAAALAWHVMGDGSVREEARSTKVLVTWLVRCEMARQKGEHAPPFPYEDL